MATIAERKDRKGQLIGFQAKIRRVGFQTQSQTFNTRREAAKWAGFIETRMDDGEFRIDDTTDERATIAEALDAYKTDLTTRAGDSGNVSRTLNRLPEDLLTKRIADLSVADLQGWRNGMVGTLAPATVNRVMTPLKAALNLAADLDQGKTIKSRAAWEIGLAALTDAEEARNVVINDAVIAALIDAAYQQSPSFGLFIEVAAVTGSRASQIAALQVGDLQAIGDPRLMMPTSKKGKGKKTVRRQPVPIPVDLAKTLMESARGKRENATLLPRDAHGTPFGNSNDHVRPWNRARKAAGLMPEAIAPYSLEEITMYALRHSSIVRQILRGVPLRVVGALHDTSVAMIERNYSRFIAGQADAIARAALPAFAVTVAPVSALAGRLPRDGECPHGHSFQDFPPYVNSTGSVVCAECARLRTKRNKEKHRAA
jgi:integrase